jgi:hypothetical protein
MTLSVALLGAGCMGDDDNGSATATGDGEGTTAAVEPGAHGRPAPIMGQVLMDFVQAAGKGDADAMWGMLSEATKASVGPTLEDFRSSTAVEFTEGLGTLADTARVFLSRRLPDDWGVAAVSGEREVEGEEEYFAYGAALIQEEGAWKLELGGVLIAALKPEPLSETDARPEIGANVGAGGDITQLLMWLDGKPLAFERGGNAPFAATLVATPSEDLQPGQQEVVVFASTDLSASAIAWTFSVQG